MKTAYATGFTLVMSVALPIFPARAADSNSKPLHSAARYYGSERGGFGWEAACEKLLRGGPLIARP